MLCTTAACSAPWGGNKNSTPLPCTTTPHRRIRHSYFWCSQIVLSLLPLPPNKAQKVLTKKSSHFQLSLKKSSHFKLFLMTLSFHTTVMCSFNSLDWRQALGTARKKSVSSHPGLCRAFGMHWWGSEIQTQTMEVMIPSSGNYSHQ